MSRGICVTVAFRRAAMLRASPQPIPMVAISIRAVRPSINRGRGPAHPKTTSPP